MKQESLSQALIVLALLIVGVVVVWGFVLVGSPSFNRKLSADRNKIEDLQKIAYGIQRYFIKQKKLPGDLTDLELSSFEDPISKKPYQFKVIDSFSYELCAEFELTSNEAGLEKRPNSYSYFDDCCRKNWDHDRGYHCFLVEIPPKERY